MNNTQSIKTIYCFTYKMYANIIQVYVQNVLNYYVQNVCVLILINNMLEDFFNTVECILKHVKILTPYMIKAHVRVMLIFYYTIILQEEG